MVQEAIEFFVTVSRFGVPQALLGVRRMLPLIWSKEPAVKEAVLNAYRQLYLSPNGNSERYGTSYSEGFSCSFSPSPFSFLWGVVGNGIQTEREIKVAVLHAELKCKVCVYQ